MNEIISVTVLIVLLVNLVMLGGTIAMMYRITKQLENLKNGLTIGSVVDFTKKNYKRIVKQIKKIKIFN